MAAFHYARDFISRQQFYKRILQRFRKQFDFEDILTKLPENSSRLI